VAEIDGSCDPNEYGNDVHGVPLRTEEGCEFCVLIQSVSASVLMSGVNAGFDFDYADVFPWGLEAFVGLYEHNVWFKFPEVGVVFGTLLLCCASGGRQKLVSYMVCLHVWRAICCAEFFPPHISYGDVTSHASFADAAEDLSTCCVVPRGVHAAHVVVLTA
jgi:hypothetical protein